MENDFDFTKTQAAARLAPFKPTVSKFYDVGEAQRFFASSGKKEFFPAGQTLFVENERSGKHGLFGKRAIHRMHFITSGEVALSVAGKVIDTIKSGEIFSEMAVISETSTGSTRSATAVVKRAA